MAGRLPLRPCFYMVATLRNVPDGYLRDGDGDNVGAIQRAKTLILVGTIVLL